MVEKITESGMEIKFLGQNFKLKKYEETLKLQPPKSLGGEVALKIAFFSQGFSKRATVLALLSKNKNGEDFSDLKNMIVAEKDSDKINKSEDLVKILGLNKKERGVFFSLSGENTQTNDTSEDTPSNFDYAFNAVKILKDYGVSSSKLEACAKDLKKAMVEQGLKKQDLKRISEGVKSGKNEFLDFIFKQHILESKLSGADQGALKKKFKENWGMNLNKFHYIDGAGKEKRFKGDFSAIASFDINTGAVVTKESFKRLPIESKIKIIDKNKDDLKLCSELFLILDKGDFHQEIKENIIDFLNVYYDKNPVKAVEVMKGMVRLDAILGVDVIEKFLFSKKIAMEKLDQKQLDEISNIVLSIPTVVSKSEGAFGAVEKKAFLESNNPNSSGLPGVFLLATRLAAKQDLKELNPSEDVISCLPIFFKAAEEINRELKGETYLNMVFQWVEKEKPALLDATLKRVNGSGEFTDFIEEKDVDEQLKYLPFASLESIEKIIESANGAKNDTIKKLQGVIAFKKLESYENMEGWKGRLNEIVADEKARFVLEEIIVDKLKDLTDVVDRNLMTCLLDQDVRKSFSPSVQALIIARSFEEADKKVEMLKEIDVYQGLKDGVCKALLDYVSTGKADGGWRPKVNGGTYPDYTVKEEENLEMILNRGSTNMRNLVASRNKSEEGVLTGEVLLSLGGKQGIRDAVGYYRLFEEGVDKLDHEGQQYLSNVLTPQATFSVPPEMRKIPVIGEAIFAFYDKRKVEKEVIIKENQLMIKVRCGDMDSVFKDELIDVVLPEISNIYVFDLEKKNGKFSIKPTPMDVKTEVKPGRCVLQTAPVETAEALGNFGGGVREEDLWNRFKSWINDPVDEEKKVQ
jgi:hypothetical protein